LKITKRTGLRPGFI